MVPKKPSFPLPTPLCRVGLATRDNQWKVAEVTDKSEAKLKGLEVSAFTHLESLSSHVGSPTMFRKRPRGEAA